MTAKPPAFARVEKRFNALAEKVFDAWLDTKIIGTFMFGPQLRDEEIVKLTVDAKVGGAFSFIVRRQGQEMDHYGRYLEIRRPTRLAFTWGIRGQGEDTSKVFIDITPDKEGCALSLAHEMAPGWEEFASRAQEGWTKMLGALGAAL
jgi:uncharacterized protein YndB with AHSA1/START domain